MPADADADADAEADDDADPDADAMGVMTYERLRQWWSFFNYYFEYLIQFSFRVLRAS